MSNKTRKTHVITTLTTVDRDKIIILIESTLMALDKAGIFVAAAYVDAALNVVRETKSI